MFSYKLDALVLQNNNNNNNNNNRCPSLIGESLYRLCYKKKNGLIIYHNMYGLQNRSKYMIRICHVLNLLIA